jgi:hypothetical protein
LKISKKFSKFEIYNFLLYLEEWNDIQEKKLNLIKLNLNENNWELFDNTYEIELISQLIKDWLEDSIINLIHFEKIKRIFIEKELGFLIYMNIQNSQNYNLLEQKTLLNSIRENLNKTDIEILLCLAKFFNFLKPKKKEELDIQEDYYILLRYLSLMILGFPGKLIKNDKWKQHGKKKFDFKNSDIYDEDNIGIMSKKINNNNKNKIHKNFNFNTNTNTNSNSNSKDEENYDMSSICFFVDCLLELVEFLQILLLKYLDLEEENKFDNSDNFNIKDVSNKIKVNNFFKEKEIFEKDSSSRINKMNYHNPPREEKISNNNIIDINESEIKLNNSNMSNSTLNCGFKIKDFINNYQIEYNINDNSFNSNNNNNNLSNNKNENDDNNNIHNNLNFMENKITKEENTNFNIIDLSKKEKSLFENPEQVSLNNTLDFNKKILKEVKDINIIFGGNQNEYKFESKIKIFKNSKSIKEEYKNNNIYSTFFDKETDSQLNNNKIFTTYINPNVKIFNDIENFQDNNFFEENNKIKKNLIKRQKTLEKFKSNFDEGNINNLNKVKDIIPTKFKEHKNEINEDREIYISDKSDDENIYIRKKFKSEITSKELQLSFSDNNISIDSNVDQRIINKKDKDIKNSFISKKTIQSGLSNTSINIIREEFKKIMNINLVKKLKKNKDKKKSNRKVVSPNIKSLDYKINNIKGKINFYFQFKFI